MRIKLTLCYDGTQFCGWQTQKNGRSVQQTVEEAVFCVTGERVRVTGSGRTDAGVHAEGQTAHFDTESSVPAEKFRPALNAFLPSDVKIIKSEAAEKDFHACDGAKKKTYRYRLYVSKTENPLKERYAARIFPAPDFEKMKEAAAKFVGEHDFAAFKASGGSAKTSVRTVYAFDVDKAGEEYIFTVCGNGFLYNMVRITAGAVIAAGEGKINAEDVSAALNNGVRPKNVKTLPAKGLCLVKVEYI